MAMRWEHYKYPLIRVGQVFQNIYLSLFSHLSFLKSQISKQLFKISVMASHDDDNNAHQTIISPNCKAYFGGVNPFLEDVVHPKWDEATASPSLDDANDVDVNYIETDKIKKASNKAPETP